MSQRFHYQLQWEYLNKFPVKIFRKLFLKNDIFFIPQIFIKNGESSEFDILPQIKTDILFPKERDTYGESKMGKGYISGDLPHQLIF